MISDDGTIVAFESVDSTLDPLDTDGKYDVFVRDLVNGITHLVSVDSLGTTSGNMDSHLDSINADGSIVAFTSDASNLHTSVTTSTDRNVYVGRDIRNGLTIVVSVNNAGNGYSHSESGVLSADGRRVMFWSYADDIPGFSDVNGNGDVFVYDFADGTTQLVSKNRSGNATGNGGSAGFALNSDGNFIAFVSIANDLIDQDFNSTWDIFLADLEADSIMLVSAAIPDDTDPDGEW